VKDKPKASTTTLRTRREVLRRRRRERQILVFGVLICTLGALVFLSYNVYVGNTEGPFTRPFTTVAVDFQSDITLPCPPSGSEPLPASEVTVRVLNSTSRSRLASTTLNDLIGRGFLDGGSGNFKRFEFEGSARISFGRDGVQQGYTVALNFENPVLLLDSRRGTSVDVILGDEFDKLVPLYDPQLAPGIPLTAAAQCQPADLIDPEPAPLNYPLAGVSPDPTASPSPSVSVSPPSGGATD
jgi:hypothetical protein